MVLIAVAVALGLGAGELLFRHLDGFRLTTLRLVPRQPLAAGLAAERQDVAHRYLPAIRLADGMRADWFDLTPPPLPGRDTPHPALVEAMRRSAGTAIGTEIIRAFNWQFVRGQLCRDAYFRELPGFAFVFDAPADAPFPRYRYPRNMVSPTGLVTNQFGWRGPPAALRKPAATIRVAFVGASTTVNDHSYPFSYPELVGFWLNLWLAAEGHAVRVEPLNAAREGTNSNDIAAVVRDELLPVEPDLVVYYEGSNQFMPRDIVRLPPLWQLRRSVEKRLATLRAYSALARRISELARLGRNFGNPAAAGAEPPKLDYDVAWPTAVDESDPPLEHPNLPGNLSVILRDLDDIKVRLAGAGSELVLSSFFWLVYDGMRLDPQRDRFMYDYLNVLFYPYRYREMERLAAFQNRVFAKFAKTRAIEFMDVAAQIPRDLNLYIDPIHATYDGVRLHAWIVAQQLAPLLRRRIAEGRLPRPARSELAVHPAFRDAERTVTIDCGRAGDPLVRTYATGLAVPPK